MGKFIDLTGKRFGKLIVSRLSGKGVDRSYRWECICDCGAITTPLGCSLRNGNTTSCGCHKKAVLANFHAGTHGMAGTRVYQAFHAMHRRCSARKGKDWPLYGGRGITVCERWERPHGFVNFLSDMGEPSPGTSLERIDVNGNYEPGNCKWGTNEEQANNKRNTRFITWDRQTNSLSGWARLLNRRPSSLWKRLAKYPLDVAMRPRLNTKGACMEHNEVSEIIEQLRAELSEQMDIMREDLEETIDNLRGQVDSLQRELEARHV
jgi:hypothetical protein